MVKIKPIETIIKNNIFVDDIRIGRVELCPDKKEIVRIYIFEPYQNKGYGTQIIQELVNQGYTNLDVFSDNIRAIHVYEKCGFIKSEPCMFKMKLKEG